MKCHLIIGNGGAGISAARAIRTVSREDEIVIVSREDCRAYSPVLATHYLAGEIPYDSVFCVDSEFYGRHGITTLFGRRVVSIDRRSRLAALEDGGSAAFDNLLIATGSRAIVPPIPGVNGPGVFTLSTADDAVRIGRWARQGNRAIVVGAGLIGTQTLDAMTSRGLSVALVEKLDQVLPLVLDAGGAALVQRRLRDRGVDLHLGDGVSRIEDHLGRKVVLLESGGRLEGHLVIMATGVSPNVDLARGCGIEVARGIVVDEFARTNIEFIYAAGDVAEGPAYPSGPTQVNATWFNAAAQGRVAGLNMAGIRTPYEGNIRMNISFPLGLPVASVGLVNRTGEDQEEVIASSQDCYRKLVFEGERLIGAVLVGNVEEIGLLASVVRGRDGSRHSKLALTQEGAFSAFARKMFAFPHSPA